MTLATSRKATSPGVTRPGRRAGRLLAALFLLLAAPLTQPARAHHILPGHALTCSVNFPCPEAIQPRVRFWIEVFRSWDRSTAVFHDPERPERVYEVFDSGHGCNHKVRTVIKAKRNQIKKTLRAVADRIEAGRKITDTGQRHLAALFPAGKPREIRAAANRIRCQSGVRDSFIAGLKRFKHYRTMIDNVLEENGLPEEIRYLPFVESSYNPGAYSKAGAAGMWQIMPKTARILGLELNATLDERLDPEAATRAAARYLKRAASTLGEVARAEDPDITRPQLNPFIITSYNYGVNGMKRAIRQVEPDFMAVLERYKSPRFQLAVKNFYASFLAARHVTLNAESYFGDLPAENGGAYQTVVLEHPTSIGRIKSVFGLGEAQLRPLNRALTRFAWRGWRLIPAGYRLRLPARTHRWQTARAKLASLHPEKVTAGGGRYTVRRGDTACGIARALKVNCSELIRANNLGRTALIFAGQKLVIPGKLVVSAGAAARREAAPRSVAATYRVRRGDTACGIARRFGVGCRTLISHNRLGRRAIIHPGQQLAIPGVTPAAARPRSLNADNQYIVRKGDSACRIARRFAVHCAALRELNGLDRRAVIHPGQKLKIPGLVVPETSETAELLARVDEIRPPAPAPTPANVNADAIPAPTQPVRYTARATGLAEVADDAAAGEVVAVVDVDDVDDAAAETDEARTEGDADTLRNLLDTLPDLGIHVNGPANAPVYTVRVEADETLGHFADWLGIGGAGALRRLNNLRYGQSIAIGRRLTLPVRDARTAERFEQRRTDYHQVLSETLKEHYDLVGIENHTVRRGDSPWSLSQQRGFPLWLLYRLNPALRSAPLVPDQVLLLPKLRAKA